MRPGFLGGGAGPVAAGAAAPPTNAAPPPPPPAPPQARPTPQAQLAEVLDLCRGPTDERRLVGLLLATKLLPTLGGDGSAAGAADPPPLQAVADAVGLHFLERLMLPLTRGGQGAPPDPERALKDAGGCALAVAVLSAFVRLPGVPADPAVLGLAPALVKIVAARGAAAALGLPPTAGGVDPATEACATGDALECLVGIVEGGGPVGPAAAGTAALAAAAAALGGCVGAGAAPPWRGLAVRLAGGLLADPVVAGAADPAALARAAPALAEALYVPPDEAAAAAAAGGGGGGGGGGRATASPDPLATQLAAVHALARLFALAAGSPILDAGLTAAARADAGGWPIVGRAGLGGLLRARAGAGARHAALAAGAGLAAAAGPAWWLAPPPPRVATDPASSPADFMRVLAEVVRVEATLGFRDAEAGGGVAVPVAGGGGGGGGGGQGARPASPPPEEIDVGGATPSEPKPEPPPSVAAAAAGAVPAMDLDGAAERWAASHGAAAAATATTATPTSTTETAGARAARVLPAVLALVEGGLGALAAGQEGEDGGDGGVGAVPPPLDAVPALPPSRPPPPPPPAFPDDMAVRAFASLRDAVEQALDYLELRAAAGPAALDADPLVPAAARAVGRLLADAPSAFGARPRSLLPDLLGAPRAGPAAAPFFLPVLALATAPLEGGEDALELDDGDRAEWLAAARQPRALAGLAAAAAAAARAAASAGAGAAALGVVDADDAALHAACTVLVGVMAGRPATDVADALPLADSLAPTAAAGLAAALSDWVGVRLGGGSGGSGGSAATAAHSAVAGSGGTPAAATCPPSDATTAAVAHALAVILHADAVASDGGGVEGAGDDEAMADPPSPPRPDAEAEAALVTALQRGWASSAVRAARAGAASRTKDELDDLPGLAAAAGEALLSWSRALVAAAAAAEARPRLAAAAAAAPWVRELLVTGGLSHSAGGAALRLFLGTLRRADVVPEDDEGGGLVH